MSDFKSQDGRYTRLVDEYSKYLKSPVQRLKFLNATLNAARPRSPLGWIPFIGALPERAAIVLELSRLLPPGESAPAAVRLTALLYRFKYAVYAASLVVILGAGGSVVYLAAQVASSLSVSTRALGNVPAGSGASASENVAGVDPTIALPLDRIWLAEKGEGYEFYSNGTRVLTEYETAGVARKFFRFDPEALFAASDRFETGSSPVGIVYHLSEGDLLPFADRFNDSLQFRSRNLLDYARDKKLYNYVIDRFGRIYRIVPDELASNHAGNSLWSDRKHVYIGLNASFIGVCFEGKTTPGKAVGPDGINEAQIYAARSLTAVLRSKYSIEDDNCVTHGLVSVNPANRLMGYHTDWVAGFPFEALGLSDKTHSELHAISVFGFGYDSAYIKAAGGSKWPGLERAEENLADAARKNGASLDDERRSRLRVYQRAHAMQKSLDSFRVDTVAESTTAP